MPRPPDAGDMVDAKRARHGGFDDGADGFSRSFGRYASLDAKKDPLVGDRHRRAVGRGFGALTLERVWHKPEAEAHVAGRARPMDSVVMFKTLVLSASTTCPMIRFEYQVAISFRSCGFWGLGLKTGFQTPRR